MKIAIIGLRSIGYPAGIDHYITEIASRLTNKLDITVFCQRPYYETKNCGPIKCIVIPTIPLKYFATPIYAILATVCATVGRYDIIHYHGLGSALCSFIPRIAGKKTIVTVHALDWEGKKWGFTARIILKLAALSATKLTNKMTVVSKVVQKYFREHYNYDAQLIPNGCSLAPKREPMLIKEKYGLDKENYILFMGRLAPGKGCEYLIEAYSGTDLPLKIVIAGDAICEHDYVTRLKKMAGKDIIFTGWVDGLLKEELLSNAYLFVQPSELEGMSGVLLEAMSYGRCVVVSDIPQNTEVIGDVGFSFKNRNVNELGILINSLVSKKDVVIRTGNMAQEKILKLYNWDKIASEWAETYRLLSVG